MRSTNTAGRGKFPPGSLLPIDTPGTLSPSYWGPKHPLEIHAFNLKLKGLPSQSVKTSGNETPGLQVDVQSRIQHLFALPLVNGAVG